MNCVLLFQSFADIGSRVAAVEKEREKLQQQVTSIIDSLLVPIRLWLSFLVCFYVVSTDVEELADQIKLGIFKQIG